MDVIFGTIEYFEKEIVNYLSEVDLSESTDECLSFITSKLKTEILYDFVCDERIRTQCLDNLFDAKNNVKSSNLEIAELNH
jgi:hypothetical protein